MWADTDGNPAAETSEAVWRELSLQKHEYNDGSVHKNDKSKTHVLTHLLVSNWTGTVQWLSSFEWSV